MQNVNGANAVINTTKGVNKQLIMSIIPQIVFMIANAIIINTTEANYDRRRGNYDS